MADVSVVDTGLTPAKTAEARWNNLAIMREPVLKRAREASRLTLPSVMPPLGHNVTTQLYEPFQSVGADGVNNLSSKLMLVLFPPGSPFFKLELDDFIAQELAQKYTDPQEFQDATSSFDEALGKIERAVTNRMDESGARTVNAEAMKHLIIAGNGLIQVLEDGTEKFYALDKYVVKRDLEGNVLEIVTKEVLSRESLPPEAMALIQAKAPSTERDNTKEEEINLFTWITRTDAGGYKVHQEIEGQVIPGTQGSYPKGKSAWLPLRWTTVSGEDYGRGRVEEYIGDLRTCESATQSIIEFAAAAAKVLFLVDESGVTEKRDLQNAPSGEIVNGALKDVGVLQLDKMADFNVLNTVLEKVEKRIAKAFLMADSVQRDAERVTAEEIRQMIGELETALGGTYSVLSTELQRPLVVRIMHAMTMKKELPVLPDGAVSPKIVTGLEGLGRQSDLQKLDAFITGVSQEFGPAAVQEYINIGAYMKLRGAALGLNITGVVKSDEEVQQAQQQAQQQETVNKLGPAAIQQIGRQTQAYNKNAASQGSLSSGQQAGASAAVPTVNPDQARG